MKSVFRHLVRLFPEAFRDEFGAGMRDAIERDYDRARERGVFAAAWAAIAIACDLVRSAVAERVRPSWVPSLAATRAGVLRRECHHVRPRDRRDGGDVQRDRVAGELPARKAGVEGGPDRVLAWRLSPTRRPIFRP